MLKLRLAVVMAAALCFTGAFLTGCPSAHGPGLKSAASLMHAVNATSKSLALGSQNSTEDHAVVCKRLLTYRDNIRPAARSAVAAAWATIRIAQEAGQEPVDYIAILKPGGCALMLGLREWGHKLPDKGASILPLIDAFSGMVCDRPGAAAVTIIVALLPVVVDLVKWIIQVVGASNDDLQKSISAWIQASPADEVDALIKAKGCEP